MATAKSRQMEAVSPVAVIGVATAVIGGIYVLSLRSHAAPRSDEAHQPPTRPGPVLKTRSRPFPSWKPIAAAAAAGFLAACWMGSNRKRLCGRCHAELLTSRGFRNGLAGRTQAALAALKDAHEFLDGFTRC